MQTHSYALELVLIVSSVATTGCLSNKVTYTSTLPESAKPVPNIRVALDKAFADKKVLHFLSHDGRWGGTDNDCELELHPQGKAKLIFYANDILSFNGTYDISTSASGSSEVLVFSPSDVEADYWPTTVMYTDGSELLLIPTDANSVRGFADENFWPFRQVDWHRP